MVGIHHSNIHDFEFMAKALKLAAKGKNTCMPNPAVGCIISKNGRIIGEGWHEKSGEDHAEVSALKSLNSSAKGSTVYVTLEPCSYHGRTGSCVDMLIKSGVSRVVFGMTDPNPKVCGQGIMELEKAGILVEGPILESEAQYLNRGYIKRHQDGLPWLTIKMAMSIDGRTAMSDGKSQWITGIYAREDVQKIRAESCAIITGIGTILQDDPSLTVRYKKSEKISRLKDASKSLNSLPLKQPLRVVVDSELKLPENAKILSSPGHVLIASAIAGQTFTSAQLDTVCLANREGKVDLLKLIKILAEKECNNVLIESGPTLAGAFMQMGLVDELIIYMAPKLLGNISRPLLCLPFIHLAQGIKLDIKDTRLVGEDIRITAQVRKN